VQKRMKVGVEPSNPFPRWDRKTRHGCPQKTEKLSDRSKKRNRGWWKVGRLRRGRVLSLQRRNERGRKPNLKSLGKKTKKREVPYQQQLRREEAARGGTVRNEGEGGKASFSLRKKRKNQSETRYVKSGRRTELQIGVEPRRKVRRKGQRRRGIGSEGSTNLKV